MSSSNIADSRLSYTRVDWMPWVVCLSAGLFFFYEFFQLNLFDVINVPLRREFDIDAAQLSWMSSTYLWADLLFLIPAGIILDRFSTRHVILIAMLVCIVGTVGFAQSQTFLGASFYHFLSGIGNAFCFLSCVVLVSRWFPPRRQALVIGCLVTMAFMGGLMAHTPLAYLSDHYGWRDALTIDGLVGVVILIWMMLIVKDSPRNHNRAALQDAAKPSFKCALVNHQNWLAGLYTCCLNLPIMVLCALWGANYLNVVHQLPDIAASNVISLILIGSIVGCPFVGWLSDYLGHRKPLMIIGALATLVTVTPLFLGITLPQEMLSILFFSLGFFTSTQVISYPLIAESNSSANTGAATGIASLIIMGGAGVGQVLFGALMQYHATTLSYTVADYQFAMWIFPIATVAALVAILFTKETYCKRFI